MQSVEERMRLALAARDEELWRFIRDPHPEVVANALLNRWLTDDMATAVAKTRTAPPEALGFLAQDVRFRECYKLKTALCRNPRTPQRVTFELLKFMRIFDLAEIAKDNNVPVAVRKKIEYLIAERVPSMPLGVKQALARRAHPPILALLMEGGDNRVIDICLGSPSMTEALVYKIINRASTHPAVIRMIAGHTKWSLGYNVRFALTRNFHTPMARVRTFIGRMKTEDLKDLYADPKLPSATRPFIFRELADRGETTAPHADVVYDLPDDDGMYCGEGADAAED